MPHITQVRAVMVPVNDQDAAIAFYTNTLGLSLVADVPFGEGERGVEVAPGDGGTAIALVPPQGEYQPGRMTGIGLASPDPRADHAELNGKGVDVDAELMGGAQRSSSLANPTTNGPSPNRLVSRRLATLQTVDARGARAAVTSGCCPRRRRAEPSSHRLVRAPR